MVVLPLGTCGGENSLRHPDLRGKWLRVCLSSKRKILTWEFDKAALLFVPKGHSGQSG